MLDYEKNIISKFLLSSRDIDELNEYNLINIYFNEYSLSVK